MSLGRVEVYGRAARGALNDRFRRYVEWLVGAVGTRAMKLALTDQNVRVAFWLHGKYHLRGTKVEAHKRARGMIFTTRRAFPPRFAAAMKKLGIDMPRPDQSDITHRTWWEKGSHRTRYIIQISNTVLMDPFQLPVTIIHELKHLTDSIQGRLYGPKWDEPRAKRAEERVLRSLTDSELRRAYEEHFGPVLANRIGEGVARVSDRVAAETFDRVRMQSTQEWIDQQNARYYARQPRVRRP